MPDFEAARRNFATFRAARPIINAAATVGHGGMAAAVSKMCFGNWLGFAFDSALDADALFSPDYGSILIELKPIQPPPAGAQFVGTITEEPVITANGMSLTLDEAAKAWQAPLEKVFPTTAAPVVLRLCYLLEITFSKNLSHEFSLYWY